MLPGPAIRPTRVDIDLSVIAKNARVLSDTAGTDVFAVIKADAYGHGAVPVARALQGKVRGFGVSLVEEGIELRDAGITSPILVMGPALAGGYDAIVRHRLTAMLSSMDDLAALAEIAASSAAAVPVHLKVDTGMGRLGLDEKTVRAAVESITDHASLELAGLATHFSCADDDEPSDSTSRTARQIDDFEQITGAFVSPGIIRHAANSSGLLRFPAARFDAVRPGLALYGAGRAGSDPRFSQAIRFTTSVSQIRQAKAGESVSYGALWTAARPSRLGVIPVGYADGLPRALTGRADVLIAGRRVPVVGAISMDITVVDCTDVPEIAVGSEVVLLGAQGNEVITTAEFASRSGLTEYEVTCGISKRVPRQYCHE